MAPQTDRGGKIACNIRNRQIRRRQGSGFGSRPAKLKWRLHRLPFVTHALSDFDPYFINRIHDTRLLQQLRHQKWLLINHGKQNLRRASRATTTMFPVQQSPLGDANAPCEGALR